MVKTLEEKLPHKFSAGDTVKVVCRGKGEWCRVGNTHKVRICKRDHEYGAVYVVDDDNESAYIRECNLELVERDKQNGGEWKRHRGGKQPVADAVRVEFKFRSGVTGECYADNLLWDHQRQDDDVMQYRIISQPQAEEVEVNKFCKGEKCSATAENIVHSQQCQLEHEMAYTGFKIDQIDGPIKWRDTVNELDAYIEEFTRERDSLIDRLASEGFSLIPPVVSIVSEFSGVDISDWRNWRAGDFVVCVEDYSKQFTQGKKYELSGLDKDERYPRVQIKADDTGEVNGWGAEKFKFHSRP